MESAIHLDLDLSVKLEGKQDLARLRWLLSKTLEIPNCYIAAAYNRSIDYQRSEREQWIIVNIVKTKGDFPSNLYIELAKQASFRFDFPKLTIIEALVKGFKCELFIEHEYYPKLWIDGPLLIFDSDGKVYAGDYLKIVGDAVSLKRNGDAIFDQISELREALKTN